jgi:hypothetical protein
LERSDSLLRPIADVIDVFPRLMTGHHRQSPTGDIGTKVCTLMLTRGDDVTERVFLDGVSVHADQCLAFAPREIIRRLLRTLSDSGSPDTAAYACSRLADLLDDYECLCSARDESLSPSVRAALATARSRAVKLRIDMKKVCTERAMPERFRAQR